MPTLQTPIPIVPRAHALCAPSSADRWFHCTGSVALEETEPETTSAASEDGTLSHDIAARWLTSGQCPAELLPDVERHAALRLYVDFVHEAIREAEAGGATVEMLVEQKLPLQDVTGERGAVCTVDTCLILRFPDYAALHVIDLKYGRGVEVDDDTLQLPIYAMAADAKYGLMDDFTQFMTTVCQPRLRSTFHTEVYTREGLDKLREQVFERAQEALQILDDGPATAMSHLKVTEKGCRFCKAQAKCPEKAAQVHKTVYAELSDIAPDKIEEAIQQPLTPIDEVTYTGPREDFAKLLPIFMSRVPEIEAWCKYVRSKVEQLLVAGQKVEGFKLVQGRAGARQWVSQEAVLPVLMANHVPRELVMTPPELRTPADIEKKIGKTFPNAWESLQGLIVQQPGKPSVAPATDKRPEFAGAVFDGESYSAEDLV